MEDREVITLESKKLGGSFTLRRSSIMDQFRIGKRRRELMREFGDPDDTEWNFAYIVAAIDTLAESKPDGFDWDKINDAAAVMELWGDFQEWERSFLNPEGDSDPEAPGSGRE
jgi:hypothetical protein